MPGGIDKFFAVAGELAQRHEVPPPSETPPELHRIARTPKLLERRVAQQLRAVESHVGKHSAAPRLRDLDGDGRPEFVSQDDRFAYDFDGYAGSVRPIQISSYDHGVFRDTTRRYPGQIRRDATEMWGLYLKYRGKTSVRGILPAWAADEYMLGRDDTVDPALESARRQGYLRCNSADLCDSPRDPARGCPARRSASRPATLPRSVVERIRLEYARGRGLSQIARTLTDEGVATAHGGRRWWPSTVRAVLLRATSA